MNPIDLIIVYLACGAPHGVYFYLQNRPNEKSYFLWLKIIFVFVFWIPFALHIVFKSRLFKTLVYNSNKSAFAEADIKDNLYSIQKNFEEIFLESREKISLFEFRQTIKRYVELTFSIESFNNAEISEQEMEIFRVVKINNIEISAACLKRRNRKRLAFHQTKARRDFLQLIENLSDSISDTRKLEIAVIEFINFLGDSAARDELEKLFAANLQTDSAQTVKTPEKVLWKTHEPKLSPAQPISARLQVTTATTNSPRSRG